MKWPTRQTMFLVCTGLSSIGGAAALIAVAMISVDTADNPAQAGVETSLVLAAAMLTSALTIPYAPVPAHRFGIRRTFVIALAVWSASFLIRGIGIGMGASAYELVLLFAPLSGVCQGISLALIQVVLRSYSPPDSHTDSAVRYAAVSGVAVAIGSPLAGLMVDAWGPAWTLIVNGLSFIPLLLFVAFVPSRSPLGQAERTNGLPWHSMVRRLRKEPRLRLLCGIGVVATIAFGPLSQLMVPLAFGLGYNLALHASFLMAALAVGAVASPWVLRWLKSMVKPIHASIVGYVVAGIALIIIALLSLLFSGTPKMLSIMVMLVLLGAFSNAARSFVVGSIVAGRTKAESVLDLSAFYFAVSLGMPVGALIWGQLIDDLGGRWALTLASLITLLVLVILRRLLARPTYVQWAAETK